MSNEQPAADPTPTVDVTSSDDQPPLECLIETYHAISEWIRFADAKAAVILTIGGAMAGFLIPSVHGVLNAPDDAKHLFAQWQVLTLSVFAAYLLLFTISSVFAFLCINPLRNHRGEHPSLEHCSLFHPAAISAKFGGQDTEAFIKAAQQGGESEMRKQVQAAILLDSHISSTKYGRVSAAIRFFALSAIAGFGYYLVAQM